VQQLIDESDFLIRVKFNKPLLGTIGLVVVAGSMHWRRWNSGSSGDFVFSDVYFEQAFW